MSDRLLVEALRERDPDAPAAMYDAHAERLYSYCWFQLRCRDAAQVALRDTFIVAEAHIGRLRDPERFGAWLYALARVECARRLPPEGQSPDMPVASHDQDDVDQRVVAWQAVRSLSATSREILDLRVRHKLSITDLAAVFDVSSKDAQEALDKAHAELEEALTAEILAHQGPYGCAERARLLRERREGFDRELNGRLMRHAGECSVCGAFRPRTVSAAKVYGLLPEARPAAELRLRVMNCFFDPELVGYQVFVATRLTAFAADGFPVQSRRPVRPLRASCPVWLRLVRTGARLVGTSLDEDVPRPTGLGAQAVRIVAVLVVMAVASAAAIAFMFGLSSTGGRDADTLAGPRPTVVPGISQRPETARPSPDHPEAVGHLDLAPVSATFPLGARVSSAPPTALQESPPPSGVAVEPSGSVQKGTLGVSPLYVDLAGESSGSVQLRAVGGTVSWAAKSRGPLRVDPAAGRLSAGKGVTVRVQVSRRPDSRGEGVITFSPGGVHVHVAWRPKAAGPRPEPTPSPTPTDSGSGGSPTPSATHRPGEATPSSTEPPSSPEPPPAESPLASDGPAPPPSSP
ncbi:DNA-directed RNA polymerase specialized sigma24 family protein [Actinomadura pelletieri DSM 43383]|uniref:DNA-directed RNA polymerase specialized sigma24 family protein n=1 Tax=Actinomadura pelletieri DSM 43383 TaxID=1120940 RepID=A0A495QG45_9ACTN|nr:sigma-70 family RNA polymerase sigma factor [Actinomadura pelletieri]RKS70733.1 DNA-directed RNA polymerase specialized sigma24 family protein [Actinomadura pelletieri DSM 43383]